MKTLKQQKLSAYQIIIKKRDGLSLTTAEIQWFVDGVTNKSIPDYQISVLLMAIWLKGFNKRETHDLTKAMLHSGKVLDFNDRTVIDKHSTGGVGDKASFILAPIAAACGVKVPMIAGRGLGHTGGTIDKVESVKGFKTSLSFKEFERKVIEEGIVLMGQTKEIAPADRKLYSLRDVTGTVESIPLITASIMSKKLAEGASGIVMDIKTGSGAFMKTKAKARALAKSLSQTALQFDKNMITVISDMSQPLGNYVGNSLEMIESVEVLKGKGPKDLTDLSVELAAGMILLAKKAKSKTDALKKAKAVIKNGKALTWFEKMIKNQGGQTKFIKDYNQLPLAKERTEVLAPKDGYISKMNNKNIGLHCVSLGGGRAKTSDKIDHGVGFIFHKKIGDKVKKGSPIVTIYHNSKQKELVGEISSKLTSKDILFSKKKVMPPKLIIETNTYWS